MSEKASPPMDGQGAEEPASPEDTDESAAAESQERDGTPAAGVAESSDSSGEPASETAEVDPPAPREDSSTDSDVDLNADPVTHRAAPYFTKWLETVSPWFDGDRTRVELAPIFTKDKGKV